MVATGLFCTKDTLENVSHGRSGLIHGGGFYLLGVQVLACVCIIAWSASITAILLLVSCFLTMHQFAYTFKIINIVF